MGGGEPWTESELEDFIDSWGSESIQAKLDVTLQNAAVFKLILDKMADLQLASQELKKKYLQNKIHI